MDSELEDAARENLSRQTLCFWPSGHTFASAVGICGASLVEFSRWWCNCLVEVCVFIVQGTIVSKASHRACACEQLHRDRLCTFVALSVLQLVFSQFATTALELQAACVLVFGEHAGD